MIQGTPIRHTPPHPEADLSQASAASGQSPAAGEGRKCRFPALDWSRWRAAAASHRGNAATLSVLLGVNFLTAAVGIVTQVQIANTLGREQFGELAYGLAVASFAQVIIRFGTDRTLVRDLVQNPAQFTRLVHGSLLLRYVITGVVIAWLLGWKAVSQSPQLTWGVLLVMIANSVFSLDLQPAYEALQRIRRHAAYFLLYRMTYFAVIWTILLAAPQMLSVLSVGLAAMVAVTLFIVLQHRWIVSRLTGRPSARELRGQAWELARRNTWVCAGSVLGLLITGLNQLLLRHRAGAAALGEYAASMQLVLAGMVCLEQVSRIGRRATADWARSQVASGRRLRFVLTYLAVMLVTVAPLAALMTIFPRQILARLYSAEYAGAASTMAILGWYTVLYAAGMVGTQCVISLGMERLYFVSVSCGSLASVLLCVALIPRYEAVGAAWALLGGQFLGLAFQAAAIAWSCLAAGRPPGGLSLVPLRGTGSK